MKSWNEMREVITAFSKRWENTNNAWGGQIGPSTNSLTVTRTLLTDLSDSCRRHTITLVGRSPRDRRTDSLTTYDPSSGIETETTTSSTGPTVIRRSLHGILLSTENSGETTFNSYDAFARVAQIWRAAVSAATGTTGVPPAGGSGVSPLQAFTYSPSGDLLATHTYTNATDYTTETYAYDMLGNRIATTDALGNTIHRTYDPFGRVLAEWGATYPVRYTYDTQGRRTSLTTFRTTGGSQLAATDGDTTTWTYDPFTGNCLSKTYADGSTITYTYTPDNLPLRTTYASGKWKENVYDAQRRLCGVIYSSPDMDYELQLDEYGNATNVQAAAGNSWRYAYGFNSILLREEFVNTGGTQFIASAMTNTISRFVDQFDRPIGYTLTVNDEPKGGIGYAYDNDGDLTRIAATNSAGRSFAVAYTNNTGYNYGYTLTTPSGNTIRRVVDRDEYRRNLVTNCATYFNSSLVDSNLYAFDALSRPIARTTGTTGVSPVDSTFTYNNRSEVVSVAIGTNLFTHVYDDIGNHLLFGDNAVAYTFTHNQVNQMVGRAAPSAPPTSFTYTPDGGLSSDGIWSYAYDAEDQLRSVTSRSLTNGAIRVRNTYDYRRRRTSKTVQRLNVTTALPPSPPVELREWETLEMRTFFYDGWNLIHETVYSVESGATNVTEIQYFWGLDLSDSLQGAGGVGGLLAVSRNGEFYFPAYDNNGNVTKYVDESSNIVAVYEYDDFGRTISQSGLLADFFRHRFSTKYFDADSGLYYYGYRHYKPQIMCWMTEDPIGVDGGANQYMFCDNSGIFMVDIEGRWPWTPNWTEQAARQAVGEKVSEMRENGYNFAADALAHFLSNTGRNIDLSQYANEISSNIHWQRSFIDSILAKLQEQDPTGTGRKFTIGDIGHAANFDKPMPLTGDIGNLFTPQFDHRFHQTQSMGLFYALYGSRYSYYGTASWKRCNNSNFLVYMTTTKINVDVKVVSWDMLTYPDGFGRTAVNSYSAANYLERNHNYKKTYLFLRWNEKGKWASTFWSTINGGGEHLKKEE